MSKFKGYDHPDNFDIAKRPSNASLTRAIVVGFFLSAMPGAVVLPLLYSWLPFEPNAVWVIALATIGGLIGMLAYIPGIKREGRRKRREFVAAGGDPEGISLRQFGVMGGMKLDDGRWQWSSPGGSGDYV